MTTIQTTQHHSAPAAGAVIQPPAAIGQTRLTSFTTVFPRGAFDRETLRDCEVDGSNLFAKPREVA